VTIREHHQGEWGRGKGEQEVGLRRNQVGKGGEKVSSASKKFKSESQGGPPFSSASQDGRDRNILAGGNVSLKLTKKKKAPG